MSNDNDDGREDPFVVDDPEDGVDDDTVGGSNTPADEDAAIDDLGSDVEIDAEIDEDAEDGLLGVSRSTRRPTIRVPDRLVGPGHRAGARPGRGE